MARFDVYAYHTRRTPFLVDVQADILSDIGTCVVVPLILINDTGTYTFNRLMPTIDMNGQPYMFMTTEIAHINRKTLGAFVLNIKDTYRQDITDAMDFLLQGF